MKQKSIMKNIQVGSSSNNISNIIKVMLLCILFGTGVQSYAADGDGPEDCGLWSDISPSTEKFLPGATRGAWTAHLRDKVCKNYEIIAVMKGRPQSGYNKGEFACNRRVILPRNLGSTATYNIESYCMPEIERFFNAQASSIETVDGQHIPVNQINRTSNFRFSGPLVNQIFVYSTLGRSKSTFSECSDNQAYDSHFYGSHSHNTCSRFLCFPPVSTPWGHPRFPKTQKIGEWTDRGGYSAGAYTGIENGYHLDFMTRYLETEDLYLMTYSIFEADSNRLGSEGFSQLDSKLKDLTGEGLDLQTFYLQIACRTEELEDAPKGWSFFEITVPDGQVFTSEDLKRFSRRRGEAVQCPLIIGSPCDPNNNQCPSHAICIGNAGNETCQLCGYTDTYCCEGPAGSKICNDKLFCSSATNLCEKEVELTIGSSCDPDNSRCPTGTLCAGTAGSTTCQVCGSLSKVCCADNICNASLTCKLGEDKCQKIVGIGKVCAPTMDIICDTGLECDNDNTNTCIKSRNKGETCDAGGYMMCKEPFDCVDGVCQQLVCIEGQCNQPGANCSDNVCSCDGDSNNFCGEGFECISNVCVQYQRCD